MITILLASAVPLILMVAPVWGIFYYFRWSTRHRKSPITLNLLRNPGQSLREQIEELTTDIMGNTFLIPIVALMLYAVYANLLLYGIKPPSELIKYTYILVFCGVAAFQVWKTFQMFERRNRLRLGHDCEVYVGQQLEQLTTHSFVIFNDFPAGGFNIDHVAIGPTGVFAIETKGRAKQVETGNENWKMSFDGKTLSFPGWTETEPVKQAERQAKWLGKWLGSATGEDLTVITVLAIPGWYIKIEKWADVRIYNGKNPLFMAKGKQVLSEQRMKAIAHQVESKCRDVKPGAYRKD